MIADDDRHGTRNSDERFEEMPNLEAVGQFAAGIAHHFNNLLTPIHANSQLVLELNDGLHPETRSLMEQTLVASRRAAQLIRQLSGFSEHQVMNVQPLDLNRTVENIWTNVVSPPKET